MSRDPVKTTPVWTLWISSMWPKWTPLQNKVDVSFILGIFDGIMCVLVWIFSSKCYFRKLNFQGMFLSNLLKIRTNHNVFVSYHLVFWSSATLTLFSQLIKCSQIRPFGYSSGWWMLIQNIAWSYLIGLAYHANRKGWAYTVVEQRCGYAAIFVFLCLRIRGSDYEKKI